jgi:hypothetical protein
MTACDLLARGFVEVSRLPWAFTYCTVCKAYCWFVWWQAPGDALGIKVCACKACETVPTSDEKHVQRFAVVKKEAAA